MVKSLALGSSWAVWCNILAQTGMDATMGTLIGNFGIMGILVWHLWYHTTRTYPLMLEKFSAEQEKTRKAFLDEQKAQRDSDDREKMELRAMLIQVLQGMRTAVHDVKDTANVVMLKAAEKQMEQGK